LSGDTGKINPFGKKFNVNDNDSVKSKVERSFNEFFKRSELRFNGGETPHDLKLTNMSVSKS